jgi:hypothetical protein
MASSRSVPRMARAPRTSILGLMRLARARHLLALAFAAGVIVAASSSAADDAGTPAPPPRSGHVVPPDLDDVEHMCALLTGCDRLPLPTGLVPRDFVGCVRAMYDELSSPGAVGSSLTLRECGLASSSCGALRTCALRGARSDVCAGRGKSGAVDLCDEGGRAITCANERVAMVRDCPRGGEQCVVQAGKAGCALGACEKEGASAACSASGTRILECKSGKLLSLDCSTFGLRCVTTADGPRCATSAPACAEKSLHCEGSGVAVACWHGHEVRVDCGTAGLACGDGAAARGTTAIGACVTTPPPRGACDPSSAPRCDGATLRWCAWGKPRGYLCKSMGLSRCVTDDKGSRCAG